MNIPGSYKRSVAKLTRFESYRSEKHSGEKIVEEYTPVQYYESIKNRVIFTYNNLVISKKKKVQRLIPTIRRWRLRGQLLQSLSILMTAFVLYALFGANDTFFRGPHNSWPNGLYVAYILFMIFAPIIVFIVGGLIQTKGRKLFAEYIEVWNPLKAPMEIVKLNDGRIAILNYLSRDMSMAKYSRAVDGNGEPLKPHSIIDESKYRDDAVIKSCYAIDKVISATAVEDGILLESSGFFYGLRRAIRTGNHSDSKTKFEYFLWTECAVDYRREIIPCIYENFDDLKGNLMAGCTNK